jgi:hypothetical protein
MKKSKEAYVVRVKVLIDKTGKAAKAEAITSKDAPAMWRT